MLDQVPRPSHSPTRFQGMEMLTPTNSSNSKRRVQLLKSRLAEKGLLQKQCYLMDLVTSNGNSNVYLHSCVTLL